MTELKPCPFCGGETEMLNGEVPCKYYIHHIDESGDCFISPILTITALTKVSAIEAWNRRAGEQNECC